MKKIEQACHWATECIVSGHTLILWDKLVVFSSKVVHINNPRLPQYMLMKNNILMNQVRRLDNKSKDSILLLRNSQMIRNLFQDIVTILCTSPNNERYDQLPKINEIEDFRVENIQKLVFSKLSLDIPRMCLCIPRRPKRDSGPLRGVIQQCQTTFGYE